MKAFFFSAILAGILALPAPSAAAEDAKEDVKKDQALPLKPSRNVDFKTTEGTWLSLDISPDGKTIVFDLVGDIYTLPIEGGQAKLIDGGMSFDSQPKFS